MTVFSDFVPRCPLTDTHDTNYEGQLGRVEMSRATIGRSKGEQGACWLAEVPRRRQNVVLVIIFPPLTMVIPL